MLVGGNIRGYTRTMTTAIVLETSKGEFALALGLGLVLLTLTVGLSATAFWLGRRTVETG
jgi:tungstate transport system permease protein